MSHSASGFPTSFAGFGSHHLGTHRCLQMREVRSWSIPVTIFCLSGMPSFFPGLGQLCPTNLLRVFSQLAKSGHLPEIQSLSLSTQPPFVPGQQCEQLLTWEVVFGSYLCGDFSPFCLPSTRDVLPSQVLKLPPSPSMRGFQVRGNFPPLQLSPQGSGPVLKSFVSFF